MATIEARDIIQRQERSLVFSHFDEDAAWHLGTSLRAQAREQDWPIVIEIGLFHRPLFFAALAGSTPSNVDWARKKRNVVERFHRSSYAIGLEMAAKKSTLEQRYGLARSDFAEHGGSFPIAVEACGVIGAMTVSGLAQLDDHMLIVRTLCQHLAKNPADFELPADGAA